MPQLQTFADKTAIILRKFAKNKVSILRKRIVAGVFLVLSRVPINSSIDRGNSFAFVKKLPQENGNFVLALRKRLFCNAKPTLLPCKTAAFGMQNNRFCNVLVINRLDKNCVCKKYLHFYHLLFVRLHFSNSILILLHKYSMERFPFLEKMNYFSFFKQKICFVKNKCLYLWHS